MKRLLSLASILVVASATSLPAQDLYSQAVSSGNTLRITIKMRLGNANSTYTITPNGSSNIVLNGPSSVTTDVNGYAAAVFTAVGTPTNPESVSITLTDSGGSVSKSYLLQSTNGQLASAWPDLLGIEGAFTGQPAASAHLQIDRMADLDGDGVYGDVVAEGGTTSTAIDYPGEFSADVNSQGTAGCVGGVAPGIFQPGSASRTVAFLTDNRVVTGPGSLVSRLNFVQDMSFAASFNSSPAIFMVSSASDSALICRDANGDGSITDSEITTFFDPAVVVNNENYSPDAISFDPTAVARAYWVSDKSGATGSPTNQGLLQLTDGDSNDSISASEVVHTLTGSTPVVTVENIAVDPTEFECVHCDGAGGVLVNSSAHGTIFRWVDGNGDDVAQTGEVSNWLTYNNGGASTYSVSADFSTGSGFPSYMGLTYFAMNLIESVTTQSGEVYFVAPTSSSGIDAGYIFRCEDIGGDGSVNELGDVTVFVDPSAITDPLGFPFDWSTGMDVGAVDANGNGAIENSELYVYAANPNGPKPACGFTQFNDLQVWRFVDLNGDGTAASAVPGEAGRVAIHPTGAFNRGLEVVPAGAFRDTFYARSTLQTVQPANCFGGTGAYLELDYLRDKHEEGTQGTPFSDNQRFEMVSRGNTSGGFGGLLIAPAEVNPPFALAFLGSTCTLGVIGPPDINIQSFAPPVNGELNFPFPVPAGFSAVTIRLQPYNLDFAFGLVLGEVTQMDIN